MNVLPSAEIRVLSGHELPLKLQVDRVQKKPYLELQLLQVRDPLALPMMSSRVGGAVGGGMMRTDSEDSLEEDGHNIVPKEEGEIYVFPPLIMSTDSVKFRTQVCISYCILMYICLNGVTVHMQ